MFRMLVTILKFLAVTELRSKIQNTSVWNAKRGQISTDTAST
jgi:hypothetical protein